MSMSPPVRRLSTTSNGSKREEDLINAYEAEEERIINVLSRKLEKLQEEKIELENVLEAESESHVNRLSRELSALRLAQQSQAQSQNGSGSANGVGTESPRVSTLLTMSDPLTPSTEVMLEAMRRENEQMRNRLVDTEREFIRISRLNEIYREELIEHRRRLGLPVDNLIGLSSAQDPYSQPTHRRSTSSMSSSPSVPLALPSHVVRPSPSVPIPRPPSQIHRPSRGERDTSETTTPLSHSPASSSESPYLSPTMSTNPASYLSTTTNMTTPPSSTSLPPTAHPVPSRAPLSYPSVPPPSLSSSFGSPVAYHMAHPSNGSNAAPSPATYEQPSTSPVDTHTNRWGVPRRGSFEWRASLMSDQSLRRSSASRSQSRRESVERGARIAETGQLVPRSRTNSVAASVALAERAEQEHEESRPDPQAT
ncbi:hypothetical protein FA95DRAFT_285370 [Auriscalpium vulgare]|uniref:Uncharacterized protein n=1 Tax=Auriscalpium vulgare TaxID=40419 RepID=A0ACB8RLD8_9AGAM|nr:hypothetical protein FA95DRAFT_285370 [Auriscalpium vulgare]